MRRKNKKYVWLGIGSCISKKIRRYEDSKYEFKAEILKAYKRIKGNWKKYGIEKGYTN